MLSNYIWAEEASQLGSSQAKLSNDYNRIRTLESSRERLNFVSTLQPFISFRCYTICFFNFFVFPSFLKVKLLFLFVNTVTEDRSPGVAQFIMPEFFQTLPQNQCQNTRGTFAGNNPDHRTNSHNQEQQNTWFCFVQIIWDKGIIIFH